MNPLRKSPYVRRLYGASVLSTASLACVDLAIDVFWSCQNATGLTLPEVPWAPVLGGGTTEPCMFPHKVRRCGIALSSCACLLSWGLAHAAQYCSVEAGKDLQRASSHARLSHLDCFAFPATQPTPCKSWPVVSHCEGIRASVVGWARPS